MNLLIMKENFKNISPKVVRKLAREGLKVYRDVKNTIAYKFSGNKLYENHITTALRNIEIREGDVVLVHSSLSRLGYVEGGANTVLSGLLKVVGSTGTVGAPTFWGNTSKYVKGARTFDVNNSPSILGTISETIRKHPEAKRSLHPTHSASFIGPLADYLAKDHHLDNTPVGPNSPYMKLVRSNGKILLLGVTLEYLTNFHTIEDITPDIPVKVYLDNPLIFKVLDQKGQELGITTCCQCPEAGKKRQCIKMESYLVEN